MIHVVCLDCACESWSGGFSGERMAHEFEHAHQQRGHTTTRKSQRTPRARDMPDVDHRDGHQGVTVVDPKGRL